MAIVALPGAFPMPYHLSRLRAGLKPFRLYWHARLRSTNDHAAALRRRGELFAPAVILAGRQTTGRGRGGNAWWSSGGSITVTFAFPIEEHLDLHQLPLVAGLAVRDAAARISGVDAIGLKWPNDVVHEGRKLAGLLCERINRLDLIGIGLNLNNRPSEAPAALRPRITSLSAIAGRAFDPTDALLAIAEHLRRLLSQRKAHPFPAILREYDRHHALVGQLVTVLAPDGSSTRGVCKGLDDRGRLLLDDAGQTHRVTAGHVQMM